MDFSVSDYAFLAHLLSSGLELRLYETDHLARILNHVACDRKYEAQRDKGHVNADEVQRLNKTLVYVSYVAFLHVDYPRIVPELVVQLAVSDVHRVDLRSAVLKHTVGEAAGGSSYVHADCLVKAEIPCFQGFGQLKTSTADIRA